MRDSCPEVWKPVVGLEGYYKVSDQGRVKSLDRVVPRGDGTVRVRGRLLSLGGIHPSGHVYVHLHGPNGDTTYQVHRLVMEAFAGPCPDGLEVCHLNGTGTDNRLANLVYGSRSDNATDQVRHGVHNMASKTHCKRGHEFTAANTYMNRGHRVCRECVRIHKRAYRLRRMAA